MEESQTVSVMDLGASTQEPTLADNLLAEMLQRLLREERLSTLSEIATAFDGVQHDINNLLIVILGCARMDNPEEVEEAAKAIYEMLEGMKRQLYLEELSRSEKIIYADTVICRAVRLLAKRSRVSLKMKHIAKDLPTVIGDPVLLLRALVNIIVNAEEAGAENIDIEASYANGTGRWVQITLTDDGPGIPDEIKGRLFDRYFSTKESSGLGLNIVFRIIEEMNGEIQVESVESEGTSFIIRLPVL